MVMYGLQHVFEQHYVMHNILGVPAVEGCLGALLLVHSYGFRVQAFRWLQVRATVRPLAMSQLISSNMSHE